MADVKQLNIKGTTYDIKDAVARADIATKQDKLPDAVKDRYLHTNASTGALEWSTVAGGVTGVKGSSESSYRTGDVSISAANIGLGNVVNTGDSATPVSGGTTKFTTGGAYTELAKKINTSDIANNVTTTTTGKVLDASQGKILSDRISNLESVGRFLSVLDCNAGTVSSQPTGSVGTTYSYKVGDYYRVGAAGNKEPKPNDVYTIDSTSGSSNFQAGTESYEIGDIIYCSNVDTTAHTSTWVKQGGSSGGKIQDVKVNGTSVVDTGTGIANINSIPASIVSGTLAVGNIPTITGAAKLSDWGNKQDVITFNTTYSASTNKAATMADINNAIGNAIAASY